MRASIVPERTHGFTRAKSLIGRQAARLVRRQIERLAEGEVTLVDGPEIFRYGQAPDLRATIAVHDPRFYQDVALGGSLGAAESYIAGRWSCDDLTALCRIFARNLDVADDLEQGWARFTAPLAKSFHWLRRNTQRGSRQNIRAHYDLGNDFFRLFLDETMNYSCGVFESRTSSMKDASVSKMDLICRKLALQPKDHLLEIGTGWGALAIHAATRYGCRVTTTTISSEQYEWAREAVRRAGVGERVEVLLADYRDLGGRFDKLVSVEMIEAVGHEFLDTYFGQCSRLLQPDGMMLLQAITMADHRYESYRRSVDFIQRFVFPGSCLPSVAAMCGSVARATDLRLTHLQDITPHYAETLRRWRSQFLERQDDVRRLGFSDQFIRLWEFYLCYCEAGFEERTIGDVQLVLAKPQYKGSAGSDGRFSRGQ